jgi:hypothetical protein
MANVSAKKITLSLSSDLFKAAKLRAAQTDQSLTDWIVDLIREELQRESQDVITGLDWGRIDSRIDQRTAALERQLELLTSKVDYLLDERSHQPQTDDRPLILNPSSH